MIDDRHHCRDGEDARVTDKSQEIWCPNAREWMSRGEHERRFVHGILTLRIGLVGRVTEPRNCCDYHRLADEAGKPVGEKCKWLDTRIPYAITGKPEFAAPGNMTLDELIQRLTQLRDDGGELICYNAEPAEQGQAAIHLVVSISESAANRAVYGHG